MRVQLKAIGVCAPAMPDWSAAQALLQGTEIQTLEPLEITAPDMLPANERRRLSPLIKLALQAGYQAIQNAGMDSESVDANLLSVFASSYGDIDITHKINTALAMPHKPVSPTLFHNSVHNAPAGYWSIGVSSPAASTSIAAADASFAAGLLESIGLLQAENRPVLLVAYDLPTDSALSRRVPSNHGFALAMLLMPVDEQSVTDGILDIELTANQVETQCAEQILEALRLDNPAARSLPLLQLLAGQQAGTVVLPYLNQLSVTIRRNA